MNKDSKKNAFGKMLSMLLAIAMVLTLVPSVTARAAGATVSVNGKNITSANAADVLGDGAMSYNASTNTLTVKKKVNGTTTIKSTAGLNMVFDQDGCMGQFTDITAQSDINITSTDMRYSSYDCFRHQVNISTNGKFTYKGNASLANIGLEDMWQSKLIIKAASIAIEKADLKKDMGYIGVCDVIMTTTGDINFKGVNFGDNYVEMNCGGNMTWTGATKDNKDYSISGSSTYYKYRVKGNLVITNYDRNCFSGKYADIEAGSMKLEGILSVGGYDEDEPTESNYGVTKTVFKTTKSDLVIDVPNQIYPNVEFISAGDLKINSGSGSSPLVYKNVLKAEKAIYLSYNADYGKIGSSDGNITFEANHGVYIESKKANVSGLDECTFKVPNAVAKIYTNTSDKTPAQTTKDLAELGKVTARKVEIVNDVPEIDVFYKTHVQTYGWEKTYSKNGAMAGTSGKSKRLEGINIYVSSRDSKKTSNIGIQYTTHCQTYGWLPWSSNNDMNGTEGESKRLEAIKIQLTGLDKDLYDVYYRVHAQTYGWLGWAKNGAPAGTAGYSKRLEGIQIVVVKKGAAAPGVNYGGVNGTNVKYPNAKAYYAKSGASPVVNLPATTNENPVIPGIDQTNVAYRTHVQKYGWQGWKFNGKMSGTSGESKRLEAIQIRLSNKQYTGSICYTTHIQSIGWQDGTKKGVPNVKDMSKWAKDGQLSGTSGQSKRLEAICIALSGEMANHYDIYYRVHAQSYGWLGWAKNGEPAGTAGYAKRLEGIQIVLVPKGQAAPGVTYNGVTGKNQKAYVAK